MLPLLIPFADWQTILPYIDKNCTTPIVPELQRGANREAAAIRLRLRGRRILAPPSTMNRWMHLGPLAIAASWPLKLVRRELAWLSLTRLALLRKDWIRSSGRTNAEIWRPCEKCWPSTKFGRLWLACRCDLAGRRA